MIIFRWGFWLLQNRRIEVKLFYSLLGYLRNDKHRIVVLFCYLTQCINCEHVHSWEAVTTKDGLEDSHWNLMCFIQRSRWPFSHRVSLSCYLIYIFLHSCSFTEIINDQVIFTQAGLEWIWSGIENRTGRQFSVWFLTLLCWFMLVKIINDWSWNG